MRLSTTNVLHKAAAEQWRRKMVTSGRQGGCAGRLCREAVQGGCAGRLCREAVQGGCAVDVIMRQENYLACQTVNRFANVSRKENFK